jgi:beta-1,4-N-acetylglucosaminyltransferase
MIFVTVGTTAFDALVRRMDELVPDLGEQVICQIGSGSYTPRQCDSLRFAPSLLEFFQRARLVVSHGGQGSIMEAVGSGKPLVGVSNPDRIDRHQDDILGRFEADQFLIWCRSLDDLGDCLTRAGSTTFRAYSEPPCRIHLVIAEFLAQRCRPRAGTAA